MRTNKHRGKRFHSNFWFVDDLCVLNDDGEFGKVYLEIYPTELELKMKHNGGHATFLQSGKFCTIFWYF